MIVSGCSEKLAKDRIVIGSQKLQYSFQLPYSWKEQTDDQKNYGQAAAFSAKDTNSQSTMFIVTNRKETVDLADFGEKKRQELSQTYQYEHIEDLYMKEFTINGLPAYKYTAFTKFQEQEVWAHIYYIETQTSLVQMVYYSADDSNYKKRAQIIDQSARSLLEVVAEPSM